MADGSKTEKATPKKRSDERKKGHVFMSQDAVSVTTLIAASAALFISGPMIADEISGFIALCVQACGDGRSIPEIFPEVAKQGILVLLKTAFPCLLVTALFAVLATFAQTRMLVTSQLLKPKFSRINPLQGFKNLFSLRSVIEALKGILKITILVALIYSSLKVIFTEGSIYLSTDLAASCSYIFELGRSLVIKIIVAFIALAAGDFFYQRWSFEKDMRMSKEEIKEEYKMTEGDPQIKGRIKETQRRRAQMRMMQQVPEADVVIRNPTHFAVALRYKPEQDNAPIVLAKGQDSLALRIVKAAEDAGVPTIENVPLARALYAQTELNQEIPQELYGAVAEILVYIFKLNDQEKLVK